MITTGDGLVAARRQTLPWFKSAAATAAYQWHTLWDKAGNPGAGVLAVGNTSAGVLVTDLTAGAPVLEAFTGGSTGYLHSVGFASSAASVLALKDRLWHAGSVSMTALATTTFTGQPSVLGRCPDGAGRGLEIWLEINQAVSATATTVVVGYTNSDGVAGRSTPATVSLSGYITGRLVAVALQAGDSGVQKIDSVTVGGTVATTGTFNVILARPLWMGRVLLANYGDVHGPDKTGFPVIYDTSALWPIVAPDSTTSGTPSLLVTAVSG